MLAIVGKNASTVNCTGEKVGLAFLNVSSILFLDVAFLHCSMTRNSTHRNYFAPGFEMYRSQVALYFYLCRDVMKQ